ncbi:MAG: metal-dependent transcriptional regulator [Solirubrobacterales bacterium]
MPTTELPAAPSIATEDYMKAIYSLTRRDPDGASTTDLAERLGVARGSVSTMLRRLDESGLVTHVPYKGVRLTGAGEQLALRVIRRHRLIELFLVTSLEIPWDEVHRYAEDLEHAASDELVEVIARKLGDPPADPHGDPIPTSGLEIDEGVTEALAELEPGERATFVRVSDADPEMLRHLSEEGIAIGDRLEMVGRAPFDGPWSVVIDGREHDLGPTLARSMRVARR